jgi:hypothetical protein
MRLKEIASILLWTGLGAALAPAQDASRRTAPSAAVDEKAMMEAWQLAAAPGTQHKALAGLEGTWTAKVKTWMSPAAPPSESEGTSENRMALGGRFLEQRYRGSFMGQPFNGVGYTGYDNVKKKYVSTWMDSMGTTIMVTEGTADGGGKIITTTGTVADALTKKTVTIKAVTTLVDADHTTYEMWGPDPAGKVYKTLEIRYVRKK